MTTCLHCGEELTPNHRCSNMERTAAEEYLDTHHMVDLLDAQIVEIQADANGKFWLNVDGRCLVRIGFVEKFAFDLGSGTLEFERGIAK